MKPLAEKIIEANIEYHSKIVNEYREQPYFNPQNIKRVRKILKNLSGNGNKKVLDIGCGTGFIVNLAKDYFSEVVGLDITPKMLEKVVKAKNIKTVLSDSAHIPFKDNYFDVCTSYSFLHHLYKFNPTFKEIFRVLKKDGVYYCDQEPNFDYYNHLRLIKTTNSEIINKELVAVKKYYENDNNISKATMDLAEYQRKANRGLKVEDLKTMLGKIGFNKTDIFFQWYVGQGEIQRKSMKNSETIDEYLTNVLPFSKYVYKYFGFIAKR